MPLSAIAWCLTAFQPRRPAAGLHAALSAAAHPLVATAPCDSPFPCPPTLVARLSAALHAHVADLAVARTFEQPHPVLPVQA